MARILTIDDDPNVALVIKWTLEQEGMKVTSITNGRNVLSYLTTPPGFDLVIVDFEMPEINGFQVLTKIRQGGWTKLPVIMLTGTKKEIQGLVELEVAAYLVKPFDIDALAAAVKAALAKVPPKEPPSSKEPSPAKAAPHQPFISVTTSPVAPPADAPAAGQIELVASTKAAPPKEAPPQIVSVKMEADLNQLIAEAGNAADVIESGNVDFNKSILAKENSPLVIMVDRIVAEAAQVGASDVHIEPQEADLVVRMRVDGVLKVMHRLPARLSGKIAARLKIMANLDISEHRLPQDGRFQIRGSTVSTECRLSTLPSIYGEKLVMRLLAQDKGNLSTAIVDMSARDKLCIDTILSAPQGIVLATGPTGSGKTTTLYTMLSKLNTEDRNIVTVEDPVEYKLPGITQVSVNTDAGLTFERVLRSLLRQDPNVILVGEMRDLETAEIGMRAAVTGHMVLSTLHTNSAAATVTRLINIGIKPYLIAAGLKLVIGQRLVRLLCPDCKKATPLVSRESALLTADERGLIGKVYRSVGCKKCHNTGFVGRRPVYEVLNLDSAELRKLVLTGDEDGLFSQAVAEGMTPMRRGAINLVAAGLSSPEDAFKVLFAH
jgi:type II secretory ATPase GspE/PulE/Tfp pilus assembly ATPase PilB-like protein